MKLRTMRADTVPPPGNSVADTDASRPPSPANTFKRAGDFFAEFRQYAAHYFAAKTAATKLTVRRVAIFAVIGVIGMLMVAAALVAATVLLLLGASNAIGSAFSPPKPWVGQMVIGLVFIGGTVIAALLVLRKWTGVSRAGTIRSFEERRREEKLKFGRDIVDRATAAPAESN